MLLLSLVDGTKGSLCEVQVTLSFKSLGSVTFFFINTFIPQGHIKLIKSEIKDNLKIFIFQINAVFCAVCIKES